MTQGMSCLKPNTDNVTNRNYNFLELTEVTKAFPPAVSRSWHDFASDGCLSINVFLSGEDRVSEKILDEIRTLYYNYAKNKQRSQVSFSLAKSIDLFPKR